MAVLSARAAITLAFFVVAALLLAGCATSRNDRITQGLFAGDTVCVFLAWAARDPPQFLDLPLADTVRLAPPPGPGSALTDPTPAAWGVVALGAGETDRYGRLDTWWLRADTLWLRASSPMEDAFLVQAGHPDQRRTGDWFLSNMSTTTTGHVSLRRVECRPR